MGTVLIIDDEQDLRDTLRTLLEDEGYPVLEASNAVTGLAELQGSAGPLVVLLDHRLPVMDGCDLLELVEHDQTLRRHAYIFMTASSRHRLEQECEDLPMDVCCAVVYKPFEIDELLDAVVKAERLLEVGE